MEPVDTAGLLYRRGLEHPVAQNTLRGLAQTQGAVETMVPFVPGFSLPIGLGVYHGTPHRWAPEPEYPKGRFRLDKIGTGEGAQAYGHGAYFAESPGVARSYEDSLSQMVFKIDGKEMTSPVGKVAAQLYHDTANIGEAISKAEVMYGNTPALGRKVKEALRTFEGRDVTLEGGTTYSLDLPIEDVPLLDWDAPLSQQPKAVREALGIDKTVKDIVEPYRHDPSMQPTRADKLRVLIVDPDATSISGKSDGRHLYNLLTEKYGKQGASDVLREAGIPGLRYYDGMSRGAGKGTRNYVIWDQDLLNRAQHIEGP